MNRVNLVMTPLGNVGSDHVTNTEEDVLGVTLMSSGELSGTIVIIYIINTLLICIHINIYICVCINLYECTYLFVG